ncbi:MAG: hypothetical protein COY19_00045 [Candidatus Marinimicrobia bacterium CG_4_10_14_0_2_um_filter_48_9]|nr:MAG: hypothetical protein COY19_00045 [Candidatus Marinimicrobia bacterium CG_4_10_14_0_2_um_filter_48_9]
MLSPYLRLESWRKMNRRIGNQINSLQHPIQTPSHFSSQHGYTIIEIITVLVLISALAAVIVPNLYDSYVSIARGSAVKQVARDLQYAEEYALAKRDTVWVEFNVPGNSYRIYGGNTTAEKALIEGTRGEHDFIVQLGFGEYVHAELTSAHFDGSPNFIIDHFGIPILNDNGRVVLNLTDTISVAAGIGTVTLQ